MGQSINVILNENVSNNISQEYFLIFLSLILVFSVFSNDVNSLKSTAKYGFYAILCTILLVAANVLSTCYSETMIANNSYDYNFFSIPKIQDFNNSFAIIVLSFSFHSYTFSIYECLEQRTTGKMMISSQVGILISTLSYMFVGGSIYLIYGQSVIEMSDITKLLSKNTFGLLINMFYATSVLMSFPISFFSLKNYIFYIIPYFKDFFISIGNIISCKKATHTNHQVKNPNNYDNLVEDKSLSTIRESEEYNSKFDSNGNFKNSTTVIPNVNKENLVRRSKSKEEDIFNWLNYNKQYPEIEECEESNMDISITKDRVKGKNKKQSKRNSAEEINEENIDQLCSPIGYKLNDFNESLNEKSDFKQFNNKIEGNLEVKDYENENENNEIVIKEVNKELKVISNKERNLEKFTNAYCLRKPPKSILKEVKEENYSNAYCLRQPKSNLRKSKSDVIEKLSPFSSDDDEANMCAKKRKCTKKKLVINDEVEIVEEVEHNQLLAKEDNDDENEQLREADFKEENNDSHSHSHHHDLSSLSKFIVTLILYVGIMIICIYFQNLKYVRKILI